MYIVDMQILLKITSTRVPVDKYRVTDSTVVLGTNLENVDRLLYVGFFPPQIG